MIEPFHIGPWHVEPALLRLTRGDEIRSLPPRAMDLLQVLRTRWGEVVTREELHQRVWNGDAVGEDVLRRTVSELRKALGDDARSPRFVETIPRRGYRLLPTSKVDTVPPPSLPSPESGSNWRGLVWVLTLAGALALLLVFWANGGRQDKASPAEVPASPLPTVRPLTSKPGAELQPALSPDGLRVAYIGGVLETGYGLWLQDLGADAPVALVLPGLDRQPAFPTWSADGHRLAWAERSKRGWRLVVRPVASGSERTVAEFDDTLVSGLAWSPAADVLAVAVQRPGAPTTLELLDLKDGRWHPLTRPPRTHGGDTRPTFSPDGGRVAYVHTRISGVQAIHVIELESGRDRRLTSFSGKVPGLAWDAEGIVFNRFLPADGRGFWRLDPDSGDTRPLPIAAHFPVHVTAAKNQLVFVDSLHRGDLFLLTGSAAFPEKPLALAPSNFWDASPQLSPDGRHVAFASLRSGSAEIWIAETDGSPPRRLTDLGSSRGGFTSHPRWSPDGRQLAFDSRDRHGGHVFVIAAFAAGPPIQITASLAGGHPVDNLVPSWSLDGTRLYFASNRTGGWQVWSRPIDGGPPRQETRDGGFFAAQDPADGSLVWTRSREPGLWRRAPDSAAASRRWTEMPDPAFWGSWVLLEDHLVIAVREGRGHRLEKIDRRTGVSTLLVTFDPRQSPNLAGPVIGATAKGELVYSGLGQAAGDLFRVESP